MEARYTVIVDALLEIPGVVLGSATNKGFGKDALKIDGRIFAMLVRSRLVVKLPRQRVHGLVSSQNGERFDPGHGRLMKEWITMEPTSDMDWLSLARESLEFVRSGC
jgi:hypothetical protein